MRASICCPASGAGGFSTSDSTTGAVFSARSSLGACASRSERRAARLRILAPAGEREPGRAQRGAGNPSARHLESPPSLSPR